MENPYLGAEVGIKRINRETYDTKTFIMAFKSKKRQRAFSFSPGQFNVIGRFGIGEAPFSITSNPENKENFEHTIRKVGNVTGILDGVQEGDIVYLRGPYGKGWPIEEVKGKNVLLVAGGIGLPPLRPFILYVKHHRAEFGKLEILYGARTPSDLIYRDRFDEFRKIKDTRLLLTVDALPEGERWDYKVGVVTILFEDMNSTPENTIVFTCGPEIMMKFVVKGLLERGFKPNQIYLSMERRMKCGIGKCGHCQLGPKFVCKDGPVFLYAEIKDLPDKIV
jgi:NAD(P)H-flavin reductase